MTRLIVNPQHLNRDEFLTPFDKIFDELMSKQFPAFQEEVGVSFNKGSYPKVNVYEYDDRIGIIAEIPGLDKENVSVEVEENVLTISGNMKCSWPNTSAPSLNFRTSPLGIFIISFPPFFSRSRRTRGVSFVLASTATRPDLPFSKS